MSVKTMMVAILEDQLIQRGVTSLQKRELFTKLAGHLSAWADEVDRAISMHVVLDE